MSHHDPAQTSFLRLLLAENERQNLTAIVSPDEAYARHIEDSLFVSTAYSLSDKRVIDVGSGGGLPGLPLRLQDPSIRLTLLDATEKKVAFLRRACEDLSLLDVACAAGRAEELGHDIRYRECFDVALSRGVAYLPLLCELCLPFVAPGGVFLAMKQGDCAEEVEASRHAISVLGGQLGGVSRYEVLDRTHALVRIDKVSATPAAYPRRFSKIKAQPL